MGNSNAPDSDAARKLIDQEKWEAASIYGDFACYNMVITNDDKIWEEYENMGSNITKWDNRSWGNCATLVYYGSSFKNRETQLEHLKMRFRYLASNG